MVLYDILQVIDRTQVGVSPAIYKVQEKKDRRQLL